MKQIKSFFNLGNFILSLKDSFDSLSRRVETHEKEILNSKKNDNDLAKDVSELRQLLLRLDSRLDKLEDIIIYSRNNPSTVNFIVDEKLLNKTKEIDSDISRKNR